MNVLFVSFIPDARWTGMGGWTHAVKQALEDQGFTVEAWFADRFPRTRALGRLAVLVFPVVLAAQLFARRRSYDAVVLHEPCGFWYGLLRRVLRQLPPMVAMCHNVERHHYEIMTRYARMGLAALAPLSRVRAPLLRHWQSNGTIRLADHVICLSSTDQAYITGGLGVPAARVTRVVNGVAYDPSPRSAGSADRRRVVWVGGWLDVKGRGVLPRLWRRVRERQPDATLTLIGTGVESAAVLREFEERDRASVSAIPRVENHERMRELYRSGSVYLMTSLSEGSPLSLLEAMAAGLPVVATSVGGIPDIVTDGVDALLFGPEHPEHGALLVCRLLEDGQMATRLSAAASERARGLSWRNTGAQIAEALRKVGGSQ